MVDRDLEPDDEVFFGISGDEWKAIVKNELESSVGFAQNGELENDRETAMKAIRGDNGIPHEENRSGVNDTCIDEAIETILPDLMEIFTGGDDVAAFDPMSPDDVEAAQQETMAVVHTFMEENDGFTNLYDYIKGALSLKTGVLKVTWQEEKVETKRIIRDVLPEQADMLVANAEQNGQVATIREDGVVELIEPRDDSRVMITAIPPEDFGVAQDTIELKDATYCVQRTRERLQDVAARGYRQDQLMRMQNDVREDDEVSRNTVEPDGQIRTGAGARVGLRTVEVHEHYVRLALDGEIKTRIFQVVTDGSGNHLLSVEEVDRIPFAAGTPYRNAHRFYGFSLADKLLETQKIKTSLMRMLLDDGYYSVNNLRYVDPDMMTDDTYDALDDPSPGTFIPIKGGRNSIGSIERAGLGFNVLEASEFISVQGEQRSGVRRADAGVKADTLHETKGGVDRLLSEAQKRTRLIARLLAVGVRDAYLLTHDLLRSNGRASAMRINEDFVNIDPTSWGFRRDAKIKIAVGSGGREERLAFLESILDKQQQIVMAQGGTSGPIVYADDVHAALEDYVKAAGLTKGRYFADPKTFTPPEPQEDPQVTIEREKMGLEREKMANNMAIKQMEAQIKAQVEQVRVQNEREIAEIKIQVEAMSGLQQRQFHPGGDLHR